MKILISADLAGATGVTWPADVEPGTEQWQRCRQMVTSEVNAAVAGAEGVLAHTYLANSITAVRLNGAPASEALLNAQVAAQYGVPVVLVTGDDRARAAADGYTPAAMKVAVKGVSPYATVCRPPAVTAAAIRTAAVTAAALAGRRAPVLAAAFRLEVEVDAAQLAQAAAIVPGVQRTGRPPDQLRQRVG